MQNFEYWNKTRFIFGKGQEDNVGEIIRGYGAKKVMILRYGTTFDFETKLNDRIISSLTKAGLQYYDFTGIERAEVDIAEKALAVVKSEGIDFLLPVGGGAVIDVGKYVSVAARYDGDVWIDFYLGNKPVPEPMMLGAISTNASSASENSPDSVIGKDGLKRTMSDPKIRPLFAVMDPELLYTLPSKLTAAGAADIIGHADERYFSATGDNYFTDLLNEAAIRTVIKYAPIAIKDPTNYDARAQMLWAALNAHNGQFEVGRTGDRGVHCIESEIGGRYHSMHGLGIGCVTLAWAKFMCTRDTAKFATWFNHCWGVEITSDINDVLRTGLQKMEDFYNAIGCPINLADLGVKEEDVDSLIETTRTTPEGKTGFYSKLTKEDLKHIYMIGLGKEVPEIFQ